MYAPGVVGIAVGLLILLIMKDSPESLGYPPIEAQKTHARKQPAPTHWSQIMPAPSSCLFTPDPCSIERSFSL